MVFNPLKTLALFTDEEIERCSLSNCKYLHGWYTTSQLLPIMFMPFTQIYATQPQGMPGHPSEPWYLGWHSLFS